jgi:hypothetical protein
MKAKDLLPLLFHELDPNLDVHRIEETKAAVTVNLCGGPDSCTAVGRVRIIPKPPPEEELPPAEPIQAHVLRAKSLAMLRSQMANLKRMVQTETIDDRPAAMMAAHYALMELNLETAIRAGELPDPIQVLRDLFEAGGLEDHFYDIREREGQGWEGPRMVKWGKACEAARRLMNC